MHQRRTMRDAASDSELFTVAAMTLHVVDYVLTKSTGNNPEAVQCMMGDLFAALERQRVIPNAERAKYRDEIRSGPEFYRLVASRTRVRSMTASVSTSAQASGCRARLGSHRR